MSTIPPPGAPQGPIPQQPANDQPLTFGQFRYYMQGLQHARDAVLLGALGILLLGVVFGPLALSQARKAEAYGVDATNGKVLAWIAIGWFCLQALFIIAYLIFFFTVALQMLRRQGVL